MDFLRSVKLIIVIKESFRFTDDATGIQISGAVMVVELMRDRKFERKREASAIGRASVSKML